MAVFQTEAPRRDVGLGVFEAFGRALVAYRERRVAAETRNLLLALTDRELEDIGLCRADVEEGQFTRLP